MRKRTMTLALAGGAVAVIVAAGTAVAGGSGDDEGHQTGPGADKATAAALAATNGGHANAVELDSENGATWEVEVTRTDGTTVDVRLDDNYKVVVIEGDAEAK